MQTPLSILQELQALGSAEKAAHLSRFFKTGPGEYGEGDRFLGVTVPQIRAVAKAHIDLPLESVAVLLESPWHEARMCGLLTLVLRCKRKKTGEVGREEIFRFYLAHTKACNNWDLVDLTCPEIVGNFLLDKPRDVLFRLAESENLWEQRIALVSTFALIRKGEFAEIQTLALRLINHPHDLIHKAIGWMLREMGKRDRAELTDFLNRHGYKLPRTALRYAIEHYPEAERKAFLRITSPNASSPIREARPCEP